MAIGEGMEMLGVGPGPRWSVIGGAPIMLLLMFGPLNTIAKVFKWLCLTLLSAFHTDPIALLVLSATINGIAAAPFLVVVMMDSGDRSTMGKNRNGKLARTMGWATAGVMAVAGIVGSCAAILGG